MKIRHLEKSDDYYDRLETVIRDCLEYHEFRLALRILKAEGRIVHPTRKYAEQAGLACIRGLGAALDGVGFCVRQRRTTTAWRIQFFVTRR